MFGSRVCAKKFFAAQGPRFLCCLFTSLHGLMIFVLAVFAKHRWPGP